MRDAIAEMNGIEKDDIEIDDTAKTATVSLQEGDPSPEQIVAHFADINKYSLAVKKS